MSIKTREERKTDVLHTAQPAGNYSHDCDVITVDDAHGLIDSIFVDHVLDGTIVDNNKDYVILYTHQSKPHPQSLNSNYTYEVVGLFSNKRAADNVIVNTEAYRWRGNNTGSVSWDAIKRSEVPAEAKWKI